MTSIAYRQVIEAPPRERRDLFLAAARRLGTPLGNVEKDFWVCWTLNALYHERPTGAPRLLFKGGTSLSKAYGLIQRFSEDIDVTVFRDDLGTSTSIEDMAKLSNKQRRATLDNIRNACRDYIAGPLANQIGSLLAHDTGGAGRIEIDQGDPDGQTLLVHYPAAEPADGAYVRPVVRIESGAKSALDPHRPVTIRPYVADDVQSLELAVTGVATIDVARTFWDKVVIAHGLRRWHERRGVLRQEGQRMSRHYYDLHCLLDSDAGKAALTDRHLGADCVRHARMCFDRPDYDLASAAAGRFAIAPRGPMIEALRRDYDATRGMIFGSAPAFDDIMASADRIEAAISIST